MNDNNKLNNLNAKLDENRHLLRRMLAVQDAEHRHLVSLLHDDFGQALVAIKSFATAISSLPQDDMSEAHELADMIKELSQDVYISAYDLMRELRAGLVTDLGLQAGVEHCLQSARLKEQAVSAVTSFVGELESLDELIKVMALRIVQECLTLIMRNDKPSQIELNIQLSKQPIGERREQPRTSSNDGEYLGHDRDIFQLEIKSDGAGINDQLMSTAPLLQNTRDRISALGGQIAINSQPEQAWDINVSLDVTEFIVPNERS